MSRYNCTRTADYFHEYKRMCQYCTKTSGCCICPLKDMDCTTDGFYDELIDIVQEWSDEHPEMPHITKAEQDFLLALKDESMTISRLGDYLTLSGDWSYAGVELHNNMFPFITSNRYWTIGELLKLEVAE